ncbi:histidine kinase [Pedobacter frigoris]|uniref:Regulator of cell autolysis n=1 Tax=Pedobacter frigoris TaxID=2571272 RepID=A0A4U1CLU8_9SPHI|nr:histidine kinase [Pedobacter frigoris]TKC08807.1 regulator of cell autolysis [Pedobacter frigoris]
MKRTIRLMLWVPICFLLFSCNNHSTPIFQHETPISSQVDTLIKITPGPSNSDSLVTVWQQMAKKPAVLKDTVLAVEVKYQLARLYGMQGRDSARILIGQALELIEPTSGNLKTKAMIYNGMGNVCSMESRQKEAGYYYNKAAAIVLSDSTIDLSFQAKSAMLLSAAQSNLKTFQYDLAEKMNRAALPLCDSLPVGDVHKQRVLVQLIQTLKMREEPAASFLPYLLKLEALHDQDPDKYNISYLYDSKMHYFSTIDQKDSLLHYQLLKMESDEQRYATDKSVVLINNLFIDYCNVATFHLEHNRQALAKPYIQQATRLQEKHPKIMFASNAIIYHEALATLYQLQGKKDQAISALKHVATIQKDIYEMENTQVAAEMSSLYQLQAKDRSIRTLNENIRLNRLQLQQNRLWLAVLVLGIILLGMMLLFLYYSFRQRRFRAEKEKVLLQQKLLRTQMEPHFIFNTLAAVQSFVRLDKKEAAIKYLNRFSRLLRSSLEMSREDLVPLNDEIEALENYISLHQMRCEDAFSYTIVHSDVQDTDAILIPPMLIQPHVENAILHGIDLESGKGNLHIYFGLEEDLLTVIIEDSGKTEKGINAPGHKSLSGIISRERMQLLGKRASVQVTTPSNSGGTIVIMKIIVVFE